MARESCATTVGRGALLGASIGAAVGAVYGTFDSFRYKRSALMKIRHIGQATVGSSFMFGLFLAAGSVLHCGR